MLWIMVKDIFDHLGVKDLNIAMIWEVLVNY